MTTHPSPSSYPEMFLKMVLNGLGYAIEKVRGKTVLEDEDRDYALNVASLGLQHPQAWRCTRDLLLLLAPLLERAGWREDWIAFLGRGVTCATEQDDVEALGEYHFYLGVLFNLLGDYPAAAFHYEHSADAFDTLAIPERHARSLNRWAYAALTSKLQIEIATSLVETAEALAMSPEEKGYSCMVRGVMALRQQTPQDAYQWFLDSLHYWEKTQEHRYMAWGLNNLGITFSELRQYENAIELLHRSLEYFELANDPAFQMVAQQNLGIAYYYLNQPTKALEYYTAALAMLRQTNRGRPLAVLYNSMGKAYLALRQFERASETYILAREIFLQVDDQGEFVNVMVNQGELLEKMGRVDDAIVLLEEALALLDSDPTIPGHSYYRNLVITDLEELRKLSAQRREVR